MKRIAFLAPVLAAPLFMGCSHTGALRDQAAADFRCPQREIVIEGHGKERTASGCGQRNTYRWTGRTWVSAGAAQPQATGAPPVQPLQYQPVQPYQQPQPVQPAQPQPAQPVQPQPATGGVQPVPITPGGWQTPPAQPQGGVQPAQPGVVYVAPSGQPPQPQPARK
jgi:hypothetical protein